METYSTRTHCFSCLWMKSNIIHFSNQCLLTYVLGCCIKYSFTTYFLLYAWYYNMWLYQINSTHFLVLDSFWYLFKNLGTNNSVAVFWVIPWYSLNMNFWKWIAESKGLKNSNVFKSIAILLSRKVENLYIDQQTFHCLAHLLGFIGFCNHVWISPVSCSYALSLSFSILIYVA